MVTADRPHLVLRALRCYEQQTYPNTELVVLDNGEEPIEHLLADVDGPVTYRYQEKEPGMTVGALRNIPLEEASGTFIVPQWDDDDWSHPERIERQVEVLQQGFDACTLQGTLIHVDHPDYFEHPFIGLLPNGVPPTIMHRRDADIRYPNLPRVHDTEYVDEWRERRYRILPWSESGLYLRYFHGDNLWEQDHFLRRIRNSPKDFLLYGWYRFVRGDLFQHPRFQLTDDMWDAFEQYLDDSFRFDLFRTYSEAEWAGRGGA
jgi:glycosyltransferase involved in cell wall biosynthesis